MLSLQAVQFISGYIQRLLPELREIPGGLSPLFLIKMKHGKSDFDWNLIKDGYDTAEASLRICLFFVLIFGFICYVFVYDFFNLLY